MEVMIKNVLDKFASRKDDWSYADLEQELLALCPNEGGAFIKEVIIDAHEEGWWPKVVERYIRTNYGVYSNVSSELDRIAAEVLGSEYKPSI